jgi:hypothetical protein
MLVLLMMMDSHSDRLDVEPKDCTCRALWSYLGDSKTNRLEKSVRQGEPSASRVCDRVAREARKQGLDPEHAIAVAYSESGFAWNPATYFKDGKRRYKSSYRGPMQVHKKYCKSRRDGCVPDGVRIILHWRNKMKTWSGAYGGYVGLYVKELRQKKPKAYARKQAYVEKVSRLVLQIRKAESKRCQRK